MLLGNGMTSGALVAVIMMVFMELTGPRRRRLNVVLDAEALPRLSEFLRKGLRQERVGTPHRRDRLLLVGEETLTSLLSEEGGVLEEDVPRRLVVDRPVGWWRRRVGVCVGG